MSKTDSSSYVAVGCCLIVVALTVGESIGAFKYVFYIGALAFCGAALMRNLRA